MKKKKSFKQWSKVKASDLASGNVNVKNVKIAGSNKKDGKNDVLPLKNDKGPVKSNKKNTAIPFKNDKFLGPKNPKQQMAQERAEKNVEKNKKLMKDFNGPRTFKDDDGKVRPTKEWAAYLKKHGSSVVAKSQLKTKPDHITQITNAWIEKHGPKPVKPGFKPVGKDPNHKHSGKKNY